MALVTLFFSTAAAGAGDGSSWANRAALFTAGVWSPLITDGDFSGGSMRCLIGPGTYACGSDLTSAMFVAGAVGVAPAVSNPLYFHGCDSSGNALSPSNPDWMCVEPVDWDSVLPVIASTGNFTISAFILYRLMKFTASGRTGSIITSDGSMDWCVVQNSTSNAAANAVSNSSLVVTNCAFACTGAIYLSVWLPASGFRNVRVRGNTGSSGSRDGVATALNVNGVGLCSFGNGGRGLVYTGTSASVAWRVHNAFMIDNVGDGVTLPNTGAQTGRQEFDRLVVTGNGGYGINGGANTHILLTNSRLRDNNGGGTGLNILWDTTNYPANLDNYTTDSDDATEYVDGDNADLSLRDYRIKSSASAIVGRGYYEQVATGGGNRVTAA
jgi:hypothetical protein